MTEEETLAAQMMRENGNSMDVNRIERRKNGRYDKLPH